MNNLLAASQGNNVNNGERIIQMTEGTGVMPPPMDQGYSVCATAGGRLLQWEHGVMVVETYMTWMGRLKIKKQANAISKLSSCLS
jgi:hypothetical protein